MKEEFVAHYVMYTHDFFLEDSIESVSPFVDKILIARTTKPWFGPSLPLDETEKVLEKLKAIYGEKIEIFAEAFPDEQSQRNFLIQKSREKGHKGAFIVDCDEVFIENSFPKMFHFILNHKVNGLGLPYLTFVKDASFCVCPPYETALFYLHLDASPSFTWGRLCNLETVTLRTENPDILHFSYIRKSDGDILAKIRSFMHAQDRVNWDEWYRRVYLRFNPRLRNFHPTHPQAWRGLQEFDPQRLPSGLQKKLAENGKLFHYQFIRGKSPLKLHLGCGGQRLDGYINIDLYHPQADLRMDICDLSYFEDNSVDEIFMNAVFEHLFTFEQPKALTEWHRVLKPNGSLIIHSLPDFDEVIKTYIQKAPGNGSPTFDLKEVRNYVFGVYDQENKWGGIHKDLFTREKVKALLEKAGFDVLEVRNVCWKNEPNPVNINLRARKSADRKDEAIRLAYQRAQDLILHQKLDEAIVALEEIFSLSPTNSTVLNDLGALYYQKGDRERALKNFVNSVSIDPLNCLAIKNLADLSLEMGHGEEAVQFYRKILAQDPQDVDALLGVGHYCLWAGQTQEARWFYEKVLRINPENDWAKLGLEKLEGKKPGPGSPQEGGRMLKLSAPPQKLTSIIILVHNQLGYTKKCLESLIAHTQVPFELIIVDNGSTDGTAEYLEAFRNEMNSGKFWCRSLEIIRNGKNLGFPAGNNQGIVKARGEYLLLLNNDVVVTPGWLDRLIAGLERKEEIGIVGPMSNYVSGAQKVKETDYDPNSLAGLSQFALDFAEKHAQQGEPTWRCVGFCMLIKRAVVEKIGGFDERYGWGHFEDDDFCLRAALAGFRSWIVKDCFVHHFGNKTFIPTGIDYDGNMAKNWETFKKKWGLSPGVAYGDSYDLSYLLKGGFVRDKHYCPLSPMENLAKKGEELFARGDLDGARKIFEEILKANPEDPEALNNMGVVAYRRSNPDLATHYFNRALKADPAYEEAMVNLGNCLMGQKEFLQAIQWFEKALGCNPNDPSLLNALGNCFLQLENFSEAEKMYEKSYHLDRNQEKVGEILATLKKVKGLGISREANLWEKNLRNGLGGDIFSS